MIESTQLNIITEGNSSSVRRGSQRESCLWLVPLAVVVQTVSNGTACRKEMPRAWRSDASAGQGRPGHRLSSGHQPAA